MQDIAGFALIWVAMNLFEVERVPLPKFIAGSVLIGLGCLLMR